ncbi:carboxylate--amine ligase [Psychroflexus montanilacus]|uniref:carboxylate--amine ligase n=1 Tax=Psychroflexus montanilacus TaxID=2873598 RepID=UPI001CCA2942|nr:ATP-grasp domain-containing protein [Psychroflexus montanilacus]MBZ9652565.1 ATP-grasp domain-containing protein [Psychroflexus montanilacus]
MTVLVLDQGRQSLPFLKSLRKSGHTVISIYSSKLSEAYFSRYPSKKLRWQSPMKNPVGFYVQLEHFIKTNTVDLVIGVSDFSAEILSKNKDEISKYTKLLVPDYQLFSKVVDKYLLMKHCMNNDIPCPTTYDISSKEDLDKFKNQLIFPVMVKPKRGIGSIGVYRYNSFKELESNYLDLFNTHGALFIQQFIQQKGGTQYQAELFLNQNSETIACVVIEKPRFFPVYGGTSTANVSVVNSEISKISKRLLEGLKWTGAADIDFIFDPIDKQYKVLEINPRVTAGIKIAFEAGVDFAELYLNFVRKKTIQPIVNYKSGVYNRLLVLEFFWYFLVDKKTRKNTKPNFFNFFGKDVIEQTFSIDDPLPFFGFIFAMIKKYLNIKRVKQKFFKKL